MDKPPEGSAAGGAFKVEVPKELAGRFKGEAEFLAWLADRLADHFASATAPPPADPEEVLRCDDCALPAVVAVDRVVSALRYNERGRRVEEPVDGDKEAYQCRLHAGRDAVWVPPAPWERYELRGSNVGGEDAGGGPGRNDGEGRDGRTVIGLVAASGRGWQAHGWVSPAGAEVGLGSFVDFEAALDAVRRHRRRTRSTP